MESDMESEERRNAARVMGRVSTEKKSDAARANGKKGGRRPGTVTGPQVNRKPIEDVECTCGKGMANVYDHLWKCKRRRAQNQRDRRDALHLQSTT
jgi:hypothetical protein